MAGNSTGHHSFPGSHAGEVDDAAHNYSSRRQIGSMQFTADRILWLAFIGIYIKKSSAFGGGQSFQAIWLSFH
jgi:hypothetical protein